MSRRAAVVGARGLLGQHVVRRLVADGVDPVVAQVPWGDETGAVTTLRALVSGLAAEPGEWDLYWCAGAGVVATAEAAMRQEVEVFRQALAAVPDGHGRGALFLASSAGGLYAGAADPPFTEVTEPAPIMPYGRAKLAMEESARGWAKRTGCPALIGRISNLYGPGQDLSKGQGLVCAVVRAQVTGEPFELGVPPETARDYVYAADAAGMAVAGMAGLRERCATSDERVVVRLICTGRTHSIADVIRTATAQSGTPVPVRQGPARVGQVADLSMRSVVWPELDAELRTPLADGIAAVHDDIRCRLAQPVESGGSS
ncbi:NAD-dependent epimerase/dehydratase family protein [Actinomycetota bacterium]